MTHPERRGGGPPLRPYVRSGRPAGGLSGSGPPPPPPAPGRSQGPPPQAPPPEPVWRQPHHSSSASRQWRERCGEAPPSRRDPPPTAATPPDWAGLPHRPHPAEDHPGHGAPAGEWRGYQQQGQEEGGTYAPAPAPAHTGPVSHHPPPLYHGSYEDERLAYPGRHGGYDGAGHRHAHSYQHGESHHDGHRGGTRRPPWNPDGYEGGSHHGYEHRDHHHSYEGSCPAPAGYADQHPAAPHGVVPPPLGEDAAWAQYPEPRPSEPQLQQQHAGEVPPPKKKGPLPGPAGSGLNINCKPFFPGGDGCDAADGSPAASPEQPPPSPTSGEGAVGRPRGRRAAPAAHSGKGRPRRASSAPTPQRSRGRGDSPSPSEAEGQQGAPCPAPAPAGCYDDPGARPEQQRPPVQQEHYLHPQVPPGHHLQPPPQQEYHHPPPPQDYLQQPPPHHLHHHAQQHQPAHQHQPEQMAPGEDAYYHYQHQVHHYHEVQHHQQHYHEQHYMQQLPEQHEHHHHHQHQQAPHQQHEPHHQHHHHHHHQYPPPPQPHHHQYHDPRDQQQPHHEERVYAQRPPPPHVHPPCPDADVYDDTRDAGPEERADTRSRQAAYAHRTSGYDAAGPAPGGSRRVRSHSVQAAGQDRRQPRDHPPPRSGDDDARRRYPARGEHSPRDRRGEHSPRDRRGGEHDTRHYYGRGPPPEDAWLPDSAQQHQPPPAGSDSYHSQPPPRQQQGGPRRGYPPAADAPPGRGAPEPAPASRPDEWLMADGQHQLLSRRTRPTHGRPPTTLRPHPAATAGCALAAAAAARAVALLLQRAGAARRGPSCADVVRAAAPAAQRGAAAVVRAGPQRVGAPQQQAAAQSAAAGSGRPAARPAGAPAAEPAAASREDDYCWVCGKVFGQLPRAEVGRHINECNELRKERLRTAKAQGRYLQRGGYVHGPPAPAAAGPAEQERREAVRLISSARQQTQQQQPAGKGDRAVDNTAWTGASTKGKRQTAAPPPDPSAVQRQQQQQQPQSGQEQQAKAERKLEKKKRQKVKTAAFAAALVAVVEAEAARPQPYSDSEGDSGCDSSDQELAADAGSGAAPGSSPERDGAGGRDGLSPLQAGRKGARAAKRGKEQRKKPPGAGLSAAEEDDLLRALSVTQFASRHGAKDSLDTKRCRQRKMQMMRDDKARRDEEMQRQQLQEHRQQAHQRQVRSELENLKAYESLRATMRTVKEHIAAERFREAVDLAAETAPQLVEGEEVRMRRLLADAHKGLGDCAAAHDALLQARGVALAAATAKKIPYGEVIDVLLHQAQLFLEKGPLQESLRHFEAALGAAEAAAESASAGGQPLQQWALELVLLKIAGDKGPPDPKVQRTLARDGLAKCVIALAAFGRSLSPEQAQRIAPLLTRGPGDHGDLVREACGLLELQRRGGEAPSPDSPTGNQEPDLDEDPLPPLALDFMPAPLQNPDSADALDSRAAKAQDPAQLNALLYMLQGMFDVGAAGPEGSQGDSVEDPLIPKHAHYDLTRGCNGGPWGVPVSRRIVHSAQ